MDNWLQIFRYKPSLKNNRGRSLSSCQISEASNLASFCFTLSPSRNTRMRFLSFCRIWSISAPITKLCLFMVPISICSVSAICTNRCLSLPILRDVSFDFMAVSADMAKMLGYLTRHSLSSTNRESSGRLRFLVLWKWWKLNKSGTSS